MVIGDYPEYILPAPEVVAARAVEAIQNGTLQPHLAATLEESVIGFVVGAAVAVAVGHPVGQEPDRRAGPVAVPRRRPGGAHPRPRAR